MASSYSTDLKLELMVTGENSGTWGDKTNTNLNLLQQSIVGYQSIALTSTNTTLAMTDATISEARNAVIKFTGVLAANATVYVASGIEKTYILDNGTTGAYTLALNQVGGASVIFGATDKTTKLVYLNGTDAVDLAFVNLTAPQTLTNKTLTAPTLTSPVINEIDDDAANEFIIFSKVTTAVNEVTVANAATGNNPNFTASGSDTNVGINFTPKGTGAVTFNGTGKIQQVLEKTTTTAVVLTGTANYDLLTQAVLYYTTAATGTFTVNLRGSSSTALNSILSVGDAATAAFLTTQGATAYYTTFVTIDGTSTNVSTKWQGGSAPTAGNVSGIDTYSFTAIKTAASTYTVLASQTQFK
jgi:hypothetical protein